MRLKEIISEAFNSPYPMTWEHGDESHDALVKLPDGTNLSIMFSMDYGAYGDEEWTVEFWRNNSQEVTGEGDQQRIFATVLAAIQDFIKTEHPERIRFSANKDVEPGQKSQTRSNLYTKLVRRYANSWGYDVDVDDFADTTVYNLHSLYEGELEEGWKDWVAGAAMGAAALGSYGDAEAAAKRQTAKPAITQQVKAPELKKITPEQSRGGYTPEELKSYVEVMAKKYLPANQVAHFIGQVAHETANFTSMIEQNPEKNLKHYAKATNPLGNKGMDDAQKYIGRGFLQITGKYNYKHFGDKIRPGLGDELLKNPDLAMRKDVAIALAVVFWRERVAPKIDAGAGHKEITTAINGRKPKGLDSRAQAVKVASADLRKPKRG